MRLEARGLAFGFRARVVGRELDLRVDAGEVLCVLGPNGSGKTTLLRTLLGLLPALGGRVTLDGEDIAAMHPARIARSMSYVPQASASHFDFNLLEIALMGRTAHLAAYQGPGARDESIALRSLARMGVDSLAARPASEVSGGERQLALIARALATEARTIVMDEPTANLDFGNQARVLEHIARLRDDGVSILLCTHDPDHAFRVADRVLLLRGGQALAQGAVAQILTAENLGRLYGVPVHVAEMATPAGPRRVCISSPPA